MEFFRSFVTPFGFKEKGNFIKEDLKVEKQSFRKGLFFSFKNNEYIRLVFWAFLLSVFVRSCLYEPFHIPSSSMKPNLLIGDYIFVSKFSYGYSRYSFPFGLAPIKGRVFDFKKPERGDVIVFKCPTNSVTFVKRLIGLPGDIIQVKNNLLYINREPVKVEFVKVDKIGFRTFYEYNETLPNGVEHLIWEETDIGPVDNTQEFIVPEGHYFFMGDNRDNSQDSRFMTKVGFVPEENLLGRVESIFMSVREPIWKFWNWNSSVRSERIFEEVR